MGSSTSTTPPPQGGTHNRISRFTVSGNTGRAAKCVLVNLPALSGATNHNGGALHFGTDGKLYVAVGDNANGSNSPMLNDPFGKMLRFNDDGIDPRTTTRSAPRKATSLAPSGRGACATPSRLPCAPATDASTSTTSAEGTWEEINLGAAGANYGWPSTEGPTNANRRHRHRCSRSTTTAQPTTPQASSAGAPSSAGRSTRTAARSRRPTAAATTSPTCAHR